MPHHNINVQYFSASNVVMLRHSGDYEALSEKFDQLWEWVEANQVPVLRTIGIYYDNPDFVPTHQLRSAACVEVRTGFQLVDRGGLPLELGTLMGGEYATLRHVGPYDELGRIWSEMTTQIEGPMGRQISDEPAYEVYVNDASDTEPQNLVTELFMPLA